MNMTYRFSRFATATAVLTMLIAQPLHAQSSRSNGLKAAIIYNVLRFVSFPNGSNSGSLNLCVARRMSATSDVAALNNKPVGNRIIAVRYIDPGVSDLSSCHVAYVGSNSTTHISRIKQRGLLLIGDDHDFIRSGGAIGLVKFGNQIRFEVNAGSARQSGIAISSKLLRLASRVKQ
ncbi:MAG: YfiR family protein [Parasphingorhabdus sp.]